MAANFSAPFSQAKGFGEARSERPFFLGVTEVLEETGDSLASVVRGEG